MNEKRLHAGGAGRALSDKKSVTFRGGALPRPLQKARVQNYKPLLIIQVLFSFLIIISSLFVAASAAYAFPNTKVASIPVGSGPYGIAGNGTYAVVAESQTGRVDIINLSTNTLLSTSVFAGTNPSMVAVTPDGTLAYVTGYGNNGANTTVYAVSLNASSNFTTSSVSVGSGPIGIAIVNNIVFVTNYGSNSWSYFPVGSSSPTTVNSWGGGPISIAANASATQVYVANSTSNTVNVFQSNFNGTNTYGVTATITTGLNQPDALLLVPNSTTLYVANGNGNTLDVINTSSKSVVATIALPSGGHPNGLALTPDNATLMVMNSPAGGITYIQVSNNSVINSLSLGSNLEQAYIPSNSNAYITDYSANMVYQLSSVVTIISASPSAINNTNNNVSTITWSSTMSGTYEVEIGGNGTMGTGTPIPGDSGSVTAGQQMTTPIYASDLINLAGGANGPYTIYIYVTTTQGSIVAYTSTNIILLTTAPQPASNLSATPGDGKALVSWTASPSLYLGGYSLYYSTGLFAINSLPATVDDAGNTTSYTLSGLTNGTLYYLGVVTYDLAGNTSPLSNIATVTPVYIPGPSEIAGQKGNCFIATAAYGSYDDFDVWVLRQFRNKVLLKSDAGRWFVRTYYRLSPPIAHFIAGHDALRAMVRILLKPFVLGSMVVLYGTTIQKFIILFLFMIIFVIAIEGVKQKGKLLFCHSRENGNP